MNTSNASERFSGPSHGLRPRLVVGIVAKNDAWRLAGTLRDAAMIADRIFLLDGGSTDETVRLANGFGATVCTITTGGDRARERNELVARIEADDTAEWLLWMNPGERFDMSTKTAFDFFLSTQLEPNRACMIVGCRTFLDEERLARFFAGEVGNAVPCERDEETVDLRLMPLRRGLAFSGRVCESLYVALSEKQFGLCAAPGRLLIGRPFQTDLPHAEVARETLRALAGIEGEGNTLVDDLLLEKGHVAFALGAVAEARAVYREVFDSSSFASLRLEAAYRINETFAVLPGGGEEQTTFLMQALDVFPLDFQLLTLLGLHLQRTKRHELAVRAFETALRFGQMSFDVWHRRMIRDMAVLALASSSRILGDLKNAIDVLASNLETLTNRREASIRLLEMYISANMEIKAQQLAASLWNGRDLVRMRGVLTGACRAAAGAWEAALLPLESEYLTGCREPLCVRWYALSLLALMRFGEAKPVLDAWCQADPGNLEAQAFRFAAATPDRFAQTLQELREAHGEALGVASLAVFEQRIDSAPQLPSNDMVRPMSGTDERVDPQSIALRQMIENSGSVPLPFVEGVAFKATDTLVFK